MRIEDLTQFHLTALLKFHGQRALTETSLARFLKAEKAVARHALNVLTGTCMIKKIGPYEWNITPEGAALLEEKGMIKPQKKVETRGRKPTTVSESVTRLAANESAALEEALNKPAAEIAPEAVHSLTAADTSEVDALLDTVTAPLNLLVKALEPGKSLYLHEQEHAILTPAEQMPKQELEPMPELNMGAPADFDTLVRQGLARLNQRLGMQPVRIDKADLKIETLQQLANSVGMVDGSVQEVLLLIVADLRMIADRTS